MNKKITWIMPETNKLFNDRARVSCTDKPEFVQAKNTVHQVSLTLFTDCNLSCKFCYEFNRSPIDANTFSYNSLVQKYEDVIKKTDKNTIFVSLLGGELLQDKFSNLMFEKYGELVDKIREITAKYNKQCVIGISSNLIHVKRERIIKLCIEKDISLYASFDPTERFSNANQFEVFIENLLIYKLHGIKIISEVILSKSNISALYNENSIGAKYFDKVYKITDGNIIFNAFSTNEHNQFSDNELSEKEQGLFLVWLYKKYSKLQELSELKDDINKKLIKTTSMCFNTFIYENKIVWTCCEPNAYITHIKNHKCFLCKYFKICKAGVCVRVYHMNEDCHRKKIYEYFESIGYSI